MLDRPFYVYAYIREVDSQTAPAGTPYYIGKGVDRRAFKKQHGRIPVPKSRSNIVFLFTGLSESEAYTKEAEMVSYYGRKDIGTGILINMCNGGLGPQRRTGFVHSPGKAPAKNKGPKIHRSTKSYNASNS